jgi:hypothetical protein
MKNMIEKKIRSKNGIMIAVASKKVNLAGTETRVRTINRGKIVIQNMSRIDKKGSVSRIKTKNKNEKMIIRVAIKKNLVGTKMSARSTDSRKIEIRTMIMRKTRSMAEEVDKTKTKLNVYLFILI